MGKKKSATKGYQTQVEVTGLNKILGGGLVLPPSLGKPKSKDSKNTIDDGLVVMISGHSGTGKSTLSLQFALSALDWRSEVGKISYSGIRYYSLEQNKADIKAKCKTLIENGYSDMSKSVAQISIKGKEWFKKDDDSDSQWLLMGWLKEISDQIKKEELLKLVVIDGLNLLDCDTREWSDLHKLVAILRRKSMVSILVLEPHTEKEDSLEYLVDMVLKLKSECDETTLSYLLHYLSITKARYQKTALGWHQYKIRDGGIIVFPSLHFNLGSASHMENQCELSSYPATIIKEPGPPDSIIGYDDKGEIPDESIIVRILGNINRGSTTVILGPRKASKTHLTLDFLRSGARMKEGGLLISVLDNQGTVQEMLKCERKGLGICEKEYTKPGCLDCDNHVYLFHQRPGFIAANEFFYYVDNSIVGQQVKRAENIKAIYEKKQDKITPKKLKEMTEIKRLVFWDLTQIAHRFPLLDKEVMFLPAFFDYLKNNKITSVFMGSSNSQMSMAASAIADNVIYCWRDYVGTKDVKIGKNINLKRNAEVLFVYVDRQEGNSNPSQRTLYCFPYKHKESPVKKIGQVRISQWLVPNWKNVIGSFNKASTMIPDIEERFGV